MRESRRLLSMMKPYYGWMVAGIMVSTVAALAALILIGVSGWFITTMALASLSGGSVAITVPAVILAGCAMIRTFGRYIERLITHQATFKFIAGLRTWFYERIEPLAPAALPDIAKGDILGRLRGDIDVLERFYIGFIVPVSVAVITFVILIGVIAYYDFTLALVLAVLFLSGGLIVPYLLYRLSRHNEEGLINQTAHLKSVGTEHVQAMGELLVYGHDSDRGAAFGNAVHDLAITQKKSSLWDSLAATCLIPVNGMALLCVMVGGVMILRQGLMSGAELVLLVMLVVAFAEVMALVPMSFQGLGRVQRAMRRIFDLTDRVPPIVNPSRPLEVSAGFDLAFKDVSFSYPDSNRTALTGLSFTLKAGETIAIIGPTGIGKSTIINLIERFYDTQKGEIYLNGHALKAYKAASVREMVSVMEQRPYIFNTTIRDNLLLGNAAATDAELDQVCRIAGLTGFIESLPDGYDTDVGEHGKQLSGGQIKRLGLARALLKPSRCLILDEPGEGLDYAMEQEILDRVKANLNGRALILITHRQANRDRMDILIDLGG